jgi:hypothetical protein
MGQDAVRELGRVHWLRDYAAAVKSAEASGKPMLVLFQEIPGCETCQSFGDQVVSHPLLVEAMEELFVPLAIHNNKKGEDERILKRFGEPAWNNPVIRYLNAKGQDVIPRVDSVWSPGGTARRMIDALQSSGHDVPAYLQLLADSQKATETAVFAMHCFWEGEGRLGGIDGVIQTQAGWIGKHEVVRVTFDPNQLDFGTLLKAAAELQCTSKVFANSDAQAKSAQKRGLPVERLSAESKFQLANASDRKYYLRNSHLGHLPLTASQATKLNAELYRSAGVKGDSNLTSRWLSPRQCQLAKLILQRTEQYESLLSDLTPPEEDHELAAYTDLLQQRLEQPRRNVDADDVGH